MLSFLKGYNLSGESENILTDAAFAGYKYARKQNPQIYHLTIQNDFALVVLNSIFGLDSDCMMMGEWARSEMSVKTNCHRSELLGLDYVQSVSRT